MRIGIFGGTGRLGIDDVVRAAQRPSRTASPATRSPRSSGSTRWACSPSIGREVPRHRARHRRRADVLRHPLTMAQQALTVQAASGGRFALGIGLSHQIVIENMFGLSFDKPVRHMREYLSVLMPLLHDGKADVRRARRSATHAARRRRPSSRRPVLVAALGPKMLELAGTVADGTVTWMTGPATLADAHRADDHRRGRAAGGRRRASSRQPADLRHRRPRRRARARGARTSRCTASCRRTAPCSTAKARRARPTSRSSATRPRSRSRSRPARRRGRHRVRRVDLRHRATSAPRRARCCSRCCERGRSRARRSSCSRRSPSQEVEIAPGLAPPRDLHDARAAHAALARPARRDATSSSRAAAGWAACSARPTGSTTTSASARGATASAPSASATASRTTSRAACTTSPPRPTSRAARGARRFVDDRPLVRRRGRDPGRHRARRALPRASSRSRRSRRGARSPASSATLRCCCCTAPTTRSCRPRRARSCRCSPGTARSCCCPATGHLLTAVGGRAPRPSARLDPCAPRGDRAQVPASLATTGANSSTLSSPTTT